MKRLGPFLLLKERSAAFCLFRRKKSYIKLLHFSRRACGVCCIHTDATPQARLGYDTVHDNAGAITVEWHVG
jgi:hypothetical protein